MGKFVETNTYEDYTREIIIETDSIFFGLVPWRNIRYIIKTPDGKIFKGKDAETLHNIYVETKKQKISSTGWYE